MLYSYYNKVKFQKNKINVDKEKSWILSFCVLSTDKC